MHGWPKLWDNSHNGTTEYVSNLRAIETLAIILFVTNLSACDCPAQDCQVYTNTVAQQLCPSLSVLFPIFSLIFPSIFYTEIGGSTTAIFHIFPKNVCFTLRQRSGFLGPACGRIQSTQWVCGCWLSNANTCLSLLPFLPWRKSADIQVCLRTLLVETLADKGFTKTLAVYDRNLCLHKSRDRSTTVVVVRAWMSLRIMGVCLRLISSCWHVLGKCHNLPYA